MYSFILQPQREVSQDRREVSQVQRAISPTCRRGARGSSGAWGRRRPHPASKGEGEALPFGLAPPAPVAPPTHRSTSLRTTNMYYMNMFYRNELEDCIYL
eukprot:1187869-Prorocentrum_minimum.AAC.6